MILRLAHLVKPFFLGTMLGFQQIEVFFPSVYETIFNGGSLSQVFFLLVSHISNYSDPNHHIFALHELTVCWNCFWWSTVSPKFPFFAKWNKSFQRWLINRTFGKVPTTSFWPGHERPMFPHRTRLTIWILTILFVIIPYPYDNLDEFWKFMLKIFLDLNLIYQLYFGIYFLVIL